MGLESRFYDGFTFYLDSRNKPFSEFYKKQGGDGLSMYKIATYLFDNFIKTNKDILNSKVLKEQPSIADKKKLADSSLKLSEKVSGWTAGSYGDYLQYGESCQVAIPGYSYETDQPVTSTWSVVHTISKAKPSILQGSSVTEYAAVVEALFVCRYGVKPQVYKGKTLKFHLPGLMIGTTKGVKKVERKKINKSMQTTIRLSVRKEESKSSKELAKLDKGEIVYVIEKGKADKADGYDGHWVKIKTKKALFGWCFDYYLTEVVKKTEKQQEKDKAVKKVNTAKTEKVKSEQKKSDATVMYRPTLDTLNFRKAPKVAKGNELGKLKTTDIVKVIEGKKEGVLNNWVKVEKVATIKVGKVTKLTATDKKAKGFVGTGWCSSSYLEEIAIKSNWTIDELHQYRLPDKVKYFVLHCTDGSKMPDDLEVKKKKKIIYKGHVYIDKDGTIFQLVPFKKFARATKVEIKTIYKKKNPWYQSSAIGAMLHFEQVFTAKQSPTEKQYEKLAFFYYKFYEANNKKKLIIVSHRALDRGIPGGHEDPPKFDFAKFYKLLKDEYNIEIKVGVDGITQGRHDYPQYLEYKVDYPPTLEDKRPEKENSTNLKIKEYYWSHKKVYKHE